MSTNQGSLDQYIRVQKLSDSTILLKRKIDQKQFILKRYSRVYIYRNPPIPSFEQYFKELKSRKGIISKYITNIVDYFEDSRFVSIIIDYYPGGSLTDFFRKNKKAMPFNYAVEIMKELIFTMEGAAREGLKNRQIWLKNIFIDSDDSEHKYRLYPSIHAHNSLELMRTEKKFSNKEHPESMIPPQVWKGEQFSEKGEVWCFGVVFYVLLNKRYPFRKLELLTDFDPFEKKQQIYHRISQNLSVFQYKNYTQALESLNENTEDFFARVFVCDPKKRMSLHQIKRHRLFRDFFDDEVYRKSSIFLLMAQRYLYDTGSIILTPISMAVARCCIQRMGTTMYKLGCKGLNIENNLVRWKRIKKQIEQTKYLEKYCEDFIDCVENDYPNFASILADDKYEEIGPLMDVYWQALASAYQQIRKHIKRGDRYLALLTAITVCYYFDELINCEDKVHEQIFGIPCLDYEKLLSVIIQNKKDQNKHIIKALIAKFSPFSG